jgi:hypothetical protein
MPKCASCNENHTTTLHAKLLHLSARGSWTIALDFPEHVWGEPDEHGCHIITLRLGGINHHLQTLPVRYDEDTDTQVHLAGEGHDSTWEALGALYPGYYDTITIAGVEHVIYAVPFAD